MNEFANSERVWRKLTLHIRSFDSFSIRACCRSTFTSVLLFGDVKSLCLRSKYNCIVVSTPVADVRVPEVHDGDVEGWKWGTGAAPAYHSVDEVFPPPLAARFVEALREARACRRPTTEQILRLFSLCERITISAGSEVVRVVAPTLTPLQRQLLELLGVPAATYLG